MKGNGEDDLPQTRLEVGSVSARSSLLLDAGAARAGAAARVLQGCLSRMCLQRVVQVLLSPLTFSPGYTDSVAMERGWCSHRAHSMNTDKMI